MSIAEKEILVKLNGTTVKYFKNLGYDIPKNINKRDKLVYDFSKRILVKVEDLQEKSNMILTKICDGCGVSKKMPYATILMHRQNGKDFCVRCGTSYAKQIIKENITYERSLEYFAKNKQMEYLLHEYSTKNEKKPCEIYPSTKDVYLWNCPNCKNEYTLSSNSRVSGNNCPYCAGVRVLKGFNDLWTTHPEVASLLVNKNKGYELTYGSHQKELFKCDKCGNVDTKLIYNVVNKGLSCLCSDGISYPEKFMMAVLNQTGIIYKKSKQWVWSQNKIYDFYISSLNTIIETHGVQHYSFSGFNRNLQEEKENDRLKEEIALVNGIENYIIIDCRKSDLGFIKNNIINSKMRSIVNLKYIDWLKCHEYACSNLVKRTCELWNDGKSVKEISEFLNISRTTIVRYLKQGKDLEWCGYDTRIIMKDTYSNTKKRLSKKVIQLTIDNKFVREWNSVRDITRCLNIDNGNISRVCRGAQTTAGGFKWIYKNEYEIN